MSFHGLIAGFVEANQPHLRRRRIKFLLMLAAALVTVTCATTVALHWGMWESLITILMSISLFNLIGWPEPVTEGFFSIFEAKLKIVVAEPDVQAAMAHIRNLPFQTKNWPETWNRKFFLDHLASSIRHTQIGDCIAVAPGVWAVIKPFGFDLSTHSFGLSDPRLQACLCIRSCATDLGHVTVLN